MARTIAFNRKLKLSWMDEICQAFLDGMPEANVKEQIRRVLSVEVKGSTPGGAQDKTRLLLQNIWLNLDIEGKEYRDSGLNILKKDKKHPRIAIFWGLSISAFPFFGSVAAILGRLFRLQGNVSSEQLKRRVKEEFGEREVVDRYSRHVYRTFSEWGCLTDNAKKGNYSAPSPIPINDPQLAVWLLEALIRSSINKSGTLQVLRQDPSLYPFSLGVISTKDLQRNSRFQIFPQGSGDDLIKLR